MQIQGRNIHFCFAEYVDVSPCCLLASDGSSIIHVYGDWLGLNASAVVVSYSGALWGQPIRTYVSPNCTIVVSNLILACSVVPGTGANLTVTVTVDGYTSTPSATTLSYVPPTVTSVIVSAGAAGVDTHVRSIRINASVYCLACQSFFCELVSDALSATPCYDLKPLLYCVCVSHLYFDVLFVVICLLMTSKLGAAAPHVRSFRLLYFFCKPHIVYMFV